VLDDDGLTVRPYQTGRALNGSRAERLWKRLIARDDLLVQPFLEIHPALRDVAFGRTS